jgi:hypothetical protein
MAKVNKQCKEHIEKFFFLNYKDKCNRDKFASCILLQTVAKNRGIGIFIVLLFRFRICTVVSVPSGKLFIDLYYRAKTRNRNYRYIILYVEYDYTADVLMYYQTSIGCSFTADDPLDSCKKISFYSFYSAIDTLLWDSFCITSDN